MKALVMGGGMGGLATAINLLDQGIEVELVEADELFGGRASSWLDEDGDMIDNALHVFFPYYVNMINFFKKMGIDKNIAWKAPEFYFMQKGGKVAVQRFANLPAPLHAAYAYLNLMKAYDEVPKWKMAFTAVAMARGMQLTGEKFEKLDEMSFQMWARRLVPDGAFKPLEPGINGLTFTPSYIISAKIMLNWFKKVSGGFETSRVGFANGGLGEIWVDTCLDYIKEKGGTFELNKAVTSINIENNEIKSVTINETEERTADIYVSAISPFALRSILPDESFFLDYFKNLWYFEYAPSLSIQIWFDRKLTDVDVTFFSTDCTFNTYADLSNVLPDIFTGGSMFEMVISPGDHVEGLPDEVIFAQVIEQLKERFPIAVDATVKKWKIVRERQGVYRAKVGMEKRRPDQRSPYSNLYVTGDYTKTPASSGGMEAAIWNANKVTEYIAADRLGKTLDLNEEFTPSPGLNPIIQPLMNYGPLVAVALLAYKFMKTFRISKRN